MYTHSFVSCVHAEMQAPGLSGSQEQSQLPEEQSQLLSWYYTINTGIIIFRWATYANVMGSPPT